MKSGYEGKSMDWQVGCSPCVRLYCIWQFGPQDQIFVKHDVWRTSQHTDKNMVLGLKCELHLWDNIPRCFCFQFSAGWQCTFVRKYVQTSKCIILELLFLISLLWGLLSDNLLFPSHFVILHLLLPLGYFCYFISYLFLSQVLCT